MRPPRLLGPISHQAVAAALALVLTAGAVTAALGQPDVGPRDRA
ncbi:MAG: hypothetical protein JWN08_2587, partial [Frankiales bacterium]|nr:hypothetical protein [Frankiales bacterium]